MYIQIRTKLGTLHQLGILFSKDAQDGISWTGNASGSDNCRHRQARTSQSDEFAFCRSVRTISQTFNNLHQGSTTCTRTQSLSEDLLGDPRGRCRQRHRKLVSTRSPVRAIVHSSPKRGLCRLSVPGYNQSVMSTVRDAAQEFQFASSLFTPGLFAPGRMLAALPGVPAALSGEPAFAIASQPLR